MSRSEAVAESPQAEPGELTEPRRPNSRALSTIAGYFNVAAVLHGMSGLAMLAVVYAGPALFAPLRALLPWGAVGMIATVAMQLRVGQLLHRRSREGGVWAIAALAPGLFNSVVHHATLVSAFSLGVSLVGLGLVAVVWKELD